jgi:hypothetical protein
LADNKAATKTTAAIDGRVKPRFVLRRFAIETSIANENSISPTNEPIR